MQFDQIKPYDLLRWRATQPGNYGQATSSKPRYFIVLSKNDITGTIHCVPLTHSGNPKSIFSRYNQPASPQLSQAINQLTGKNDQATSYLNTKQLTTLTKTVFSGDRQIKHIGNLGLLLPTNELRQINHQVKTTLQQIKHDLINYHQEAQKNGQVKNYQHRWQGGEPLLSIRDLKEFNIANNLATKPKHPHRYQPVVRPAPRKYNRTQFKRRPPTTNDFEL